QGLKPIDRLAKSLALAAIFQRLVERRLRAPERAGGDVETAAVKSRHCDAETGSFLPEQIFNRNPAIIENNSSCRLRVPAHLEFIAAERKAGCIFWHNDGGNSLGTVLASTHHRHIDIRGASTRNELLRAVEDIMVAVARGARSERGGIRT